MKKIVNIVTVFGLVFSAVLTAQAQDTSVSISATSEGGAPVRVETHGEVRGDIPPVRPLLQEGKDIKMEARNDINRLRQSGREISQQMNNEARVEILKSREEFKAQMETRKVELQAKIDVKREELKKKLAGIKNEKKIALSLNINDKFQALNKKAVERLAESVDRQEDAVKRLKERMSNPAFSSQNNSSVSVQIANAETKIAEVRAKLTAQSAKVYTVNVTTEAALKANTEAQRLALRSDIDVLHDSIKDVSELIRSAAKDLALVK